MRLSILSAFWVGLVLIVLGDSHGEGYLLLALSIRTIYPEEGR